MFIHDWKVLMWVIELLIQIFCGVKATIRIKAIAPVNPVKEGTFFALHCQIWDLDKDHKVLISRDFDDGRSVVLFWDDSPSEVEQREYLAVRTLTDGSIVYFLSVTDISQADRGTYSCKIMRTKGTYSEIAVESVFIDVMHFPNDGNPVCDHFDPTPIPSGTRITFNCSSEEGFPAVSMRWIRMGQDKVFVGQSTTYKSRVYNAFTITATNQDDGAVYQCQVTSTAFPEYVKTCHIGPLRILPGPNYESDKDIDKPSRTAPKQKEPITVEKIPTKVFVNTKSNFNVDCADTCSLIKSSSTRWIIATIIASAFALIFVVVGVVLLLKYYNLTAFDNDDREFTPQVCIPREQIYSELDRKRGDCRVYMALERREKLDMHPGFSDN